MVDAGPPRRTPVAHDVGRFCTARAAEAATVTGGGRSVARNGTVLEQAQILTSQTVAALTTGLELDGWLRTAAPDLAEGLTWVVRCVERDPPPGTRRSRR